MQNSYKALFFLAFSFSLFSSIYSQDCPGTITNENAYIVVTDGRLEAGGDSSLATTTETNGSPCAVAINNQDTGEPWARYHIVIRLEDYGLVPGDELRIGIDGKNDTGYGRIEVNLDNRANSAIFSENFTSEWSRVEETFLIPQVETLDIWLFSNYARATPGLVFYDNLLIEKIEPFKPFITTWKTDNLGISNNNQITIPTFPGEIYDYNVDWGDGSISSGVTGDITHSYQEAGIYEVSITGLFPRIYFNGYVSSSNDFGKLITINHWGDIEWSSMASAFAGCSNLKMEANDVPNLANATDLGFMFLNCSSLIDNPSWNTWDVSTITSMEAMFYVSNFNFDIRDWDVSNVESMSLMFAESPFNQPIGNWNVRSSTNMNEMFLSSSFNQNIGNWDVSNVQNMGYMFKNSPFNQDIGNWNVGKVRSMYEMFTNAVNFNQNVANWDISNVRFMNGMFNGAALSSINYDLLLLGWSGNAVLQSGVQFGAGDANYCIAIEARQKLINDYGWVITDAGAKCPTDFSEGFITTWKTDNPGISEPNQITIPTYQYQTYDYSVDWGDGSISENVTGSITHTYESPGTYEVAIIGQFPHIYFNNAFNSTSDSDKLLLVNQWGNIQWQSMQRAFAGCTNLDVIATDVPKLEFVYSLDSMFLEAKSLVYNATINNWDTSNVGDMHQMFSSAENFNQPLSNWDVSNVNGMARMFQVTPFNQDIASWNVGQVANMEWMFSNASDFNQDIGSWDTSQVIYMSGMFGGAKKFNQDIGGWDTGSVVSMFGMFTQAEQFNQYIGDWNLENVTEIGQIFYEAKSFNQDLGKWNVSKVTNLSTAFYSASSFDQDLSTWNVSNVENMYNIFDYSGLTTENYDATLIGWSQLPQVKNNVNLGALQISYCEATDARQDLIDNYNWTITDDGFELNCGIGEQLPFVTTWKTDNPGASDNNQITIPTYTSQSWEKQIVYDYTVDWGDGTSDTGVTSDITHTYATPGVYTVSITGEFPRIYFEARDIEKDNQKILTVEQWGNYGWESMEGAFYNCTNLDVTAIDIPNLTWLENISNMFYNCSALVGTTSFGNWDTGNVKDMYGIFFNAAQFNQPINSWNVSNVGTFFDMFNGATLFNQPLQSWDLNSAFGISGMFGNSNFNQDIGGWDISSVEYAENLFYNNSEFNQDISSWDVSSLIGMSGMFQGATNFNQDIGNWNVSKVQRMFYVFQGASNFNQNLGQWNVGSVTEMFGIFDNSGLSNENYDNILLGWSNLPSLRSNVILGAVDNQFCASAQARANITAIYGWTITDAGKSDACDVSEFRPFITTWNVTNEITIPTHQSGDAGYSLIYDYTVDWGDGSTNENVTGNISHNYSTPGVYTVSISGTFPKIEFTESGENSTRIQSIDQWGDVEWLNLRGAFANCSNLDVLAKDVPSISGVIDAGNMFANCTSLMGNDSFNKWNVSSLQQVDGMFDGAIAFNQNLGNWNTVQMTDMSRMFRASGFSNSLGIWDVAQVTAMNEMFTGSQMTTVNYDNTLVGWSRLNNLQSNVVFDAGLSTFCSGEAARQMLQETYSWTITDNGKICDNQDAFISTWKTDNLGKTANNEISVPVWGGPYTIDWGDGNIDTNVYGEQSHSYLVPGIYTVSMTGDLNSIYFGSYPGNESNSDAGKILEINQWGTTNWTYFESAFQGCVNMDIVAVDTPDLQNITSLRSMFGYCKVLKGNASFNEWNTTNITSLGSTFNACEQFNADISNWDVGNVTSMNGLFSGNEKFNQDLSNWDVSNVLYMNFMFSGASSFDQSIGAWNVSNVTDMSSMFQSANFNQDISEWNVGNVTNMSNMFGNARNFNQDISSWDVSNVVNMNYMFGFTNFDQNIGAWDVSGVSNMQGLFQATKISTENYDKTLLGWSQLPTLQNNVELGAFQNTYCTSREARQQIIESYGWVIYDAGIDVNCDVAGPSLSTFSPNGEDVELSGSIILTANFDEPIQWQENAEPIVIYDVTNNTVFASILPSSETISFIENNFNISIDQDFVPNTQYEVRIGANSLEDLNGNIFEGLVYGTWTFSTASAPCILAIEEQPQDVIICEEGANTEFLVKATGTGSLNYNWQALGNGFTEWTDIDDQDGTNTLVISTPVSLDSNGLQYRVVITDDQGTVGLEDDCTVVSNVAILSVNPLPTVSLNTVETILLNTSGEVVEGLGGGLPEGGVYSGTGILDNGDGSSFNFEIGELGIGEYTVTYTFTNENGCIGTATDIIVVEQAPLLCPSTRILLSSQLEVDNFASTYDVGNCAFDGGIRISGADISNLDGLSSLTNIGGWLEIDLNPNLENLDGLSALTSIGGRLYIGFNLSLENLNGLSSLQSVAGNLYIQANSAITNLEGLPSLKTIQGLLYIENNTNLNNINGLSNVVTVGGNLEILNNANLSNCSITAVCNDTVVVGETLISNNTGDCEDLPTALAYCNPVIVCSDNLENEDPSMVLPVGTIALGVDNVVGTATDTNGSACALEVGNVDSGQPWGSYRIAIRLDDYGIVAGDELFVGVDGKSLTGQARLEITPNNRPNNSLGAQTFGNIWSRYETAFIVPEDIETIDLWFFSNYGQQTAGTALYDNLTVTNLSAGGANVLPVANAGLDIIETDSDESGLEAVILNGSNSVDLDGTIVSYIWTENGSEIATGSIPTVEFDLGVHVVTLTVTDNLGGTDTDNVQITVTETTTVVCSDNLANEDPSMVLPVGTVALGVDNVVGTATDTNGSACALEVGNVDSGQPWGSYRIAIRLDDYGIVAGDELFVGVDGKSLTGQARLEITPNNRPNNSLGAQTFGNIWSRYETAFIVPEDIETIDLWFFSNYAQQTAGSAVYDNLTVTNLSAGGANVLPVANAGLDIIETDSDESGLEAVILNGSNSVDLDGTIVSYIWTENGSEIATGSIPTVEFDLGVHVVTLTVTDNLGGTDTDNVQITVTETTTVVCSDNLANEDPSMVLPVGTVALGVDNVVGTATDTNGSACALEVGNVDSGQPWGSYRIAIRLDDYGIVAGDELFVGVDGKSLTGQARLEITPNNRPNNSLGAQTFGNIWSRYETAFIVPEDIETIDLWFFSNYAQQTAGSAVYDNLEVINLSSGTSGKSIQEIKPQNGLTVYPNPANIETTISFNQPTTVGTIQIFDVTGRLVQTIKGGLIDNNGTPLNVQEMPTGTYFVKTTDTSGVEFQQQMLIQRQ